MLSCYLASLAGRSLKDAFKLDELSDQIGCKRITYSHNGANFVDWLPPQDPFLASPNLWKERPVVLLVRDPRDVLVSAYHHARFRTKDFDGSLSEFVRDSRTGIEKVLTAYNHWYDNRHLASTFDVISYESLHSAPENGASITLRRAGLTEIDFDILAKCIDFCRFENFQKKEAEGFFGDKSMQSVGMDDDRARKVRQGKIGDFESFLSSEDLEYIQLQMETLGNPFSHLILPSCQKNP